MRSIMPEFSANRQNTNVELRMNRRSAGGFPRRRESRGPAQNFRAAESSYARGA